jgi:hypothetical protein
MQFAAAVLSFDTEATVARTSRNQRPNDRVLLGEMVSRLRSRKK